MQFGQFVSFFHRKTFNICPNNNDKPYAKEGHSVEDNTVFIGRKPSMNYVLAVVTQFNTGANIVTIKARGRAISKAVDVAEIVRHRFLTSTTVEDITIGTENVEDEDREGGINVSWIEIVLDKGSISKGSDDDRGEE
jgi:DNA-binding protein